MNQLDVELIQDIRRLYAAGNSIKTLSDWSGLTCRTIGKILNVNYIFKG